MFTLHALTFDLLAQTMRFPTMLTECSVAAMKNFIRNIEGIYIYIYTLCHVPPSPQLDLESSWGWPQDMPDIVAIMR